MVAAHVEIIVGIVADVVGIANAGIGHYGASAAGLVGVLARPVAAAGTQAGVKGVAAVELVSNFMGHIIDVEGVANGVV